MSAPNSQIVAQLSQTRQRMRAGRPMTGIDSDNLYEAIQALSGPADSAWRHKCAMLWKLLDDIDTLDDACKDRDGAFRVAAYAIQRRRFEVMSGEEYDATFKLPAPSSEAGKERSGWKLVPIEPTDAMKTAGDKTGFLMCGDECYHDHSDNAGTVWEAMIAASPDATEERHG